MDVCTAKTWLGSLYKGLSTRVAFVAVDLPYWLQRHSTAALSYTRRTAMGVALVSRAAYCVHNTYRGPRRRSRVPATSPRNLARWSCDRETSFLSRMRLHGDCARLWGDLLRQHWRQGAGGDRGGSRALCRDVNCFLVRSIDRPTRCQVMTGASETVGFETCFWMLRYMWVGAQPFDIP
jgi:hypothetical protein